MIRILHFAHGVWHMGRITQILDTFDEYIDTTLQHLPRPHDYNEMVFRSPRWYSAALRHTKSTKSNPHAPRFQHTPTEKVNPSVKPTSTKSTLQATSKAAKKQHCMRHMFRIQLATLPPHSTALTHHERAAVQQDAQKREAIE